MDVRGSRLLLWAMFAHSSIYRALRQLIVLVSTRSQGFYLQVDYSADSLGGLMGVSHEVCA